MIVDLVPSSNQATDDIVRSAFDSAGQRCSALRVLYIQDEIYDDLLEMIKGNMARTKNWKPSKS
jgi:RHH-type proline utilization regulon transcriptional repressor/proline dehydrogenase/delta 1-pyrroline-5-carboxylate dehydrogenase